MLKWFNKLDTYRRLFVLILAGYFCAFLYIKWSSIVSPIYLYLFNRPGFDQATQISSINENLGLGFKDPIAEMIIALKQLGISVVISLALAYAVFKKKPEA